jgi:hypothetical protein
LPCNRVETAEDSDINKLQEEKRECAAAAAHYRAAALELAAARQNPERLALEPRVW